MGFKLRCSETRGFARTDSDRRAWAGGLRSQGGTRRRCARSALCVIVLGVIVIALRSTPLRGYLPWGCLLTALLILWLVPALQESASASERAQSAAERVLPLLREELQALGARVGDPIHLRIFKQESELELWVQPNSVGEFKLFRTYPICAWSGRLGPKTREGDRQAPEGFYSVRRSQLNPRSQFHLSFNLGYPNAYERGQGWTGSALMVHGACVSIGCYAMTDPAIEQIYTLVDRALASGQNAVAVHAFPFRMSTAQRQRFGGSEHNSFWDLLQPAYDVFEVDRVPAEVQVRAAGYRIAPAAPLRP